MMICTLVFLGFSDFLYSKVIGFLFLEMYGYNMGQWQLFLRTILKMITILLHSIMNQAIDTYGIILTMYYYTQN